MISKWNPSDSTETVLLKADECASNNGTKATPALSADILGDWREEVIWRTLDNKELHIYTTVIPTEHRFYTLMHDPQYRLSIAWQNVAYNQPPHTSFYFGAGMSQPPRPRITTNRLNRTPPWSAAAWRRFVIDHARSRPKRRQAAALQGGAQSLSR
jgi:rhamnogalacturonan endolyase